MHAGRHYSLREVLTWTRRETLLFFVLSAVPLGLELAGLDIPQIPWQPLAVLGTAVAFVTGFKSNAAYGRLWEARKIWGGIVNASRTWVLMSRDFQQEPDASVTRRLVYRQVAWFTALRHQLRQPRSWEAQQLKHNDEYRKNNFTVPELESSIEDDLAPLLSTDELQRVLATKNRASAVLDLQSADLRELAARGAITEFRHVELARLLKDLFDLQGRCERIKNFPYPRQFATLNRIFVWLFIVLVPFGLHSTLEPDAIWLVVPFTVIVAWVFHTMDKIGSVSENPFEGGANDVPISTMSRGIEIDLRELLAEQDLPAPLAPQHNILI